MTSFWLAVAISLVAAIVYLWQSVQTQTLTANEEEAQPATGAKNKDVYTMLLVVLIFLLIPFGYYWLGNYDKQVEWQTAQLQFQSLKQGTDYNSASSNKIQELVLALRTAIDKDPENGQLWYMLAEVYFQLQMTDLADASLTRALSIEMRPDWLVANAQVVTARGEEADIARAEYLLKQAVQIQPDHQSALLTLGFIQLRQQKFELSIYTWERLKSILAQSGNDTSRLQKQIDFAKRELVKKSKQ